MNTALPSFRLFSVWTLIGTFAFGVIMPLATFAELSNDSLLLGQGPRSRTAYDGPVSQRTECVPLVRYFRQPWFARAAAYRLRSGRPDLRLSAGVYRGGRVAVGVFTQATWANAKSANSFYGITPPQSATTGLPVFDAGSGWIFGSAGLLWSIDLSRDWIAVGSLEARRLHGDAA